MDEIKERKKVLYISYDGITDPLGQSQVLPYLIGLSKKGHQIYLISFEKAEKHNLQQEMIETLCIDNNIKWFPQVYTKKPPVLSTLKDIRWMQKVAEKIIRNNAIDFVHCRSYIAALVGLRLKEKMNLPFIFDMRGFWADERVDTGIWNIQNPIYKRIYQYFKDKEKIFLEKASHIVSLTENAKKVIETWQSDQTQFAPISVIPCCVNLAMFNPNNIHFQEKEELRSKLNIKHNEFILGYIGTIGNWYNLPEMMDFFKILQKEKKESKFLLVTSENSEKIYDLAFERQISRDNIIIVNPERKEVPIYISLFSASIFFVKQSFSKIASSPTKQGELMAMGIPMVCNSMIGDVDTILEKYEAGIIIPNFEHESLTNAVNSLLKEEYFPSIIQNGAREFYNLENGINKYHHIYMQF